MQPNLPAGTVGTLRELLVAADLMERGYHVFRAISPACPCDLVVQKDEVTLRVEVRSLRRNRIGYLYDGVTRSDIGNFDVVANVAMDKTIRYATYDEAASREQGRIVLAPYEP